MHTALTFIFGEQGCAGSSPSHSSLTFGVLPRGKASCRRRAKLGAPRKLSHPHQLNRREQPHPQNSRRCVWGTCLRHLISSGGHGEPPLGTWLDIPAAGTPHCARGPPPPNTRRSSLGPPGTGTRNRPAARQREIMFHISPTCGMPLTSGETSSPKKLNSDKQMLPG